VSGRYAAQRAEVESVADENAVDDELDGPRLEDHQDGIDRREATIRLMPRQNWRMKARMRA